MGPTGLHCAPKAVTFGRRTVAPVVPQTAHHLDLEGHGMSTGSATSSAAVAVNKSYRFAWLKATAKAFNPWPAWHFMTILQLTSVLVVLVFIISIARALRLYGIGLPSVVLEGSSRKEPV